jgi:xylan 1,4-beta-xylosidase
MTAIKMRSLRIAITTIALALSLQAEAQPSVTIEVHADHLQGSLPTSWNFFGYDEPNYSYAPNGKKLLNEIGRLSPTPAYTRVHNLFTTGDGSSSLKWGSTNVYTEDASGRPIYDWKIVDRIFDTFHDSGLKPLVELGFMPEALSTHPEPYRHNFPNGSIYTGWAYPPKDYPKFAELVFQFTKHLRERYGDAEVKTWLWEVWNEPDIAYWQGTPEEYFELYDYSAEAVLRALPAAKIGGPDSTGPGRPKSAQFLKDFLQHCDTGTNYATGKTGAPLDFISFHPKGSPTWQADHVQMGIATQLNAIEQGFKIVASFPKWKNTPIVLGESDPEGCAACSAEKNPQNGYRNGALYAAYEAEAYSQTLALAEREHISLLGAVTWAFEFEDQPYFAGFRELASGGLDKPVLNTFRMLGLMNHDRIKATNSAALITEQIVRDGVRAAPDIRAIATRSDRSLELLVWNYHDDDLPAAPATVHLTVAGLPETATRALLQHFRIDAQHSNAFTAWREMGSPQSPSPEQYAKLESAGQLQLLTSPSWIPLEHGRASLQFELPRQGLSLIRISW